MLFRKSDLNEGNLLEGVSSVSSLLARLKHFWLLVLSMSHLGLLAAQTNVTTSIRDNHNLLAIIE